MSNPWDSIEASETDKNIVVSGEESKAKAEADNAWDEENDESTKEPEWMKTDYDSTRARRPRGRGERRPRGEHVARRGRGDSHHGEGQNRTHDEGHRGGSRGRGDFERRGRGRFPRGHRGGPRENRHVGERTKIKRHRLFENNHNQEVIYREDEQQIDPEKLSTQSHFRANRNWDELNIPENILRAIEEIGYVYPSKIQSFGIDVILQEGFENLIAQAPNGSGKTATFIIGSLCRLDLNNPKVQVVCLSHTIELSNQIYQEYLKITTKIGATISMISKDSKPSDYGQVVVTVAGSFLKALRSKALDLSGLKVFVVDEADHLFDVKNSQEFYNGLKHIVTSNEIPGNTQFLLFSATFSDQVKKDIVQILRDMNEIHIKKEELMLDTIKHFYVRVDQKEKIARFEQLLKRVTKGITIAFINTCNFAKTVCMRLQQQGHKTALLMGRDMSVDERNLTMQDFREGKYGVLITTNLLARGIDNTKVNVVVNFDLPRMIGSKDMDYVLYLHRSGRCSRFGRNGICFNLIATDEELIELKTIEDYYSITINELHDLEEIEKLLEESYAI